MISFSEQNAGAHFLHAAGCSIPLHDAFTLSVSSAILDMSAEVINALHSS